MNPDLRLVAREPGVVADPTDQQFRLLVSSVTDYAIYLMDGADEQHDERKIIWCDIAMDPRRMPKSQHYRT